MKQETKLQTEIIAQLSDPDAKRPVDWVLSWATELFETYEHMPQKNSIVAYAQTIEPLVSWLSTAERCRFGESLWRDRREWLGSHSVEEPYPFTGLVNYLSPRIGGS